MRACPYVLAALLASPAARAAPPPRFEIAPMRLDAVIVQDADFPLLDEGLVERSLVHAAATFSERFETRAPDFAVLTRYDVDAFLDAFADPEDPRCAPLYASRYRGGGPSELESRRAEATRFLQQWPLDALRGFVPEADHGRVTSHAEVFELYVTRYSATVARLADVKTPAGTRLVEPARSARRSFAAWNCALLRQDRFDIVLTNTFILADLTHEPHPHAVFGKAKVGGIAAQSPGRAPLWGESLLASTFGIDTRVPELAELPARPATREERARILGAYLLAHELAHAIFGMPDVFDHPAGCLMTSRPGQTYLDGLVELDANPSPCPRCRPYVDARSLYDRGAVAYELGENELATVLLNRSIKAMPKHYHGSRKKRASRALMLAAQAYRGLGSSARATQYADLAVELDPSARRPGLTLASRPAVVPTKTASTATVAR